MKGLIIKPYWGNKILSGDKVWEIRGSNTKHRGETGIIFSGTGKIYGTALLVNSFEITRWEFDNNREKHNIEPWTFDESRYKKLYAWEFDCAEFYHEPIPYNHPQGAVIWVNLGGIK